MYIKFLPSSCHDSILVNTLFKSSFTISVINFSISLSLILPFNNNTSSYLIFPSAYAFNWSSILTASLNPPFDSSAIKFNDLSSIFMFSCAQIYFNLSLIVATGIGLNSNDWHLDIIVKGILCGSVVASINIICSGGSSNVFNNALNAPVVNIWTSSIIYILYFDTVGSNVIWFLISRISSTPLFDAASISIISTFSFELLLIHISHFSHDKPSSGCKQFIVLANIFAILVLPVPRGPTNRYACVSLLFLITFFNVCTTICWPYTSSNVFGLYFLYSAWYFIKPPL